MATKNRGNARNRPQTTKSTEIELIAIPTAPRRDGFTSGDWRKAMRMAESTERPDRTLLYDLYNDVLLDAHLESVIGKRRDNIKGMKVGFDTGGKPNEAIDALMVMPWFREMLANHLDSVFFGYTASWIDLSGGAFRKYEMLRRKHLIPEKHLFVKRQSDRTGVDYTESPLANYVIHSGKADDLGLLLKVVVWVLFKRGDISDWATFNEMFAMPFRKGKYPQFDTAAKKALAEACRDSAGKSWAIIPDTTDLEFIQNQASGSSSAYLEFAEFCDKQISKAIVRNTMTTDAEGGQYKGEVHEHSERGVFASDRQEVLDFLNTEFRRILELHDFNPGSGMFTCVEEDHICLKDRIGIDKEVASHVVIPAAYWYKRYGIPVPEGGPQVAAPEAPETTEATSLSAVLQELHELKACFALGLQQADNAPMVVAPKPKRGFFA